MPDWRPQPLSGVKPAYLDLADMLGHAIASGELPPRRRLPTVRDLAATLGLATATVLRGYRESRERGLIDGTVGRGTFVLPQSEERLLPLEIFAARGFLAPGVYNLRSNIVPAPVEWSTELGLKRLLPSSAQQRALLGAVYRAGGTIEPGELREAGARWASWCGIEAQAESMMLAAGGQHAIAAALCAIGGPGSCIAVPDITNAGVLTAARTLGIRLLPVKVDHDGIDPHHLEYVCRTERPAAFYCAPSGDNPIPISTSADRREAIAEIARRHGVWIIEDDSVGPLVDRSVASLAQRAADRTLWLASVAQTLGFGFRLAFVRVPVQLEASMQGALRTLAWTGATPGALLAARALGDGTVERVIAGRRAAIKDRHAIVSKVLGEGRCMISPGIPYVWFPTPPGWRTENLYNALFAAGVAVASAAQFAANPNKPRRGIRISAGGLLSLAEYEDALKRIAETCAHPGRHRSSR